MTTLSSCKFDIPFVLQNDLLDWTKCELQSITLAVGDRQFALYDSYISLHRNGGHSRTTTIQKVTYDTPSIVESINSGSWQIPEGVLFRFRIGINATYNQETHGVLYELQEFDFLRMETEAFVDLANDEVMRHCAAAFKACQNARPVSFSLLVLTSSSQ